MCYTILHQYSFSTYSSVRLVMQLENAIMWLVELFNGELRISMSLDPLSVQIVVFLISFVYKSLIILIIFIRYRWMLLRFFFFKMKWFSGSVDYNSTTRLFVMKDRSVFIEATRSFSRVKGINSLVKSSLYINSLKIRCLCHLMLRLVYARYHNSCFLLILSINMSVVIMTMWHVAWVITKR